MSLNVFSIQKNQYSIIRFFRLNQIQRNFKIYSQRHSDIESLELKQTRKNLFLEWTNHIDHIGNTHLSLGGYGGWGIWLWKFCPLLVKFIISKLWFHLAPSFIPCNYFNKQLLIIFFCLGYSLIIHWWILILKMCNI